jgi:cysteine desulfurase / selenocysteine lyase
MRANDEQFWIELRNDFPILNRKIGKHPLVYFDNAASSQKPRQVLQAIQHSYEYSYANVHRGVHRLSNECTDLFEDVRRKTARFIGAQSDKNVIFTRGTTDGINLVAHGLAANYFKPGSRILVSHMEHHANIVPWQMAAEKSGAQLDVIPLLPDGRLNMEIFEQKIQEASMLAVTWVSNALGIVNPIAYMVQAAKKRGIPVLVDAAQAAPHMPVNVGELQPDFLVFSTHKALGPTGLGILYLNDHWAENLPPLHGGGEMIDRVTFEKTTYQNAPFKFEAGTPHITGVFAWGAAIEYLNQLGMAEVFAREHYLFTYLREAVRFALPDLIVYGDVEEKAAVLSFGYKGVHPYDIGVLLDQQGIAVRTGHHCTQPLMDFFGVPGTARASLAFYNTTEEIDIFVNQLQRSLSILM